MALSTMTLAPAYCVFQGDDRQLPLLLPVRLWYVRPAGGLRTIRSWLDSSVQIYEPQL